MPIIRSTSAGTSYRRNHVGVAHFVVACDEFGWVYIPGSSQEAIGAFHLEFVVPRYQQLCEATHGHAVCVGVRLSEEVLGEELRVLKD